MRNISSRFERHFNGIIDLRKKLEQAMTATESFGRDARSIMNTLGSIKDPGTAKESVEEIPENLIENNILCQILYFMILKQVLPISIGVRIIQIGAISRSSFARIDRFDARCRLSPGIIPEAMALIVNKSSPKMLKGSNLSHYEMIRQFVVTLKKWGKATYMGFNSIEFDEEFLRCTLFQTLEYPYLCTSATNSALC